RERSSSQIDTPAPVSCSMGPGTAVDCVIGLPLGGALAADVLPGPCVRPGPSRGGAARGPTSESTKGQSWSPVPPSDGEAAAPGASPPRAAAIDSRAAAATASDVMPNSRYSTW